MTVHPPSPPRIWPAIAAVFYKNRLPCVLLNAVVITLVASYYSWPAAAGAWRALGEFKMHWGYAFSLGSTVFSAALLPTAVQWLTKALPPGALWKRLLCLVLYWGYRGVEIDVFYHLQAWLFGTGNDAITLVKKVVLDQFGYSTVWAVPTYLVLLRWIDMDFSWSRALASMDRLFWTHTFPTVLITNWLVWIPTVTLVYSLPPPLQFPLFAVVMCFFVLMVTLLARGEVRPAAQTV